MMLPRTALIATLLLAPHSIAGAALIVQGYNQDHHDRFHNDPGFIGAAYDWSGVGRGSWWATMISDSYFLSATHAHPANNSTVRFYETNDPSGVFEEHTVESGMAIAGSDLWLGKLESTVSSSIAKFPILSAAGMASFTDLDLWLFGLSTMAPTQANMRLGRNELDTVIEDFSHPNLGSASGDVFLYDFDDPGGVGDDEARVSSGDSGAPTFTIVNGQPVLVGIHWFTYTDDETEVPGSGDTLVSSLIGSLNSSMVGESVTVVNGSRTILALLLVSIVRLAILARRRREPFERGQRIRFDVFRSIM